MINNILVTGSLGQLGSYLCDDFIKDELEVIGLDNGINKCPIIPDEVSNLTIMGDIRDDKIVTNITKDIDAIVHCAAQTSVEKSINDPKFDADNNITGTINLLQSVVESSSIKRFVYISSAATYGNPIKFPIIENHPQNPLSGYGLSKFTAEKYVNMFWQIHKLPTVIIRPFNFYSKRANPNSPYSGVITKFISRIKDDKPPIIEGKGDQTRDFVHINDVVKMIRLVLENNDSIGESFNCGVGKPITIKNLADIVIKISGKSLKPTYIEKRKGDIKHSYSDISKAKKILNFEPSVELKDGLKDLI